jgi:hypothetical protein
MYCARGGTLVLLDVIGDVSHLKVPPPGALKTDARKK